MAENEGGTPASEGTPATETPAVQEAKVTGINEAGQQVTEGEEVPAEEAATEGEAEGAETAAEGEEEDPAARKTKWRQTKMQARIDELTREKFAERRAREAIETRLRAIEAGEATETEQPAVLPEAEIERRAEVKAEAKAAEKSFADACNAVYDKGVDAHGEEFKEALVNFQTLVGEGFRSITNIALATDDPAKVILELGRDPEEAERILKLPAARMAIEMDRLARGRAKPAKPVSKAPAPIRPVGGTGSGTDPMRDDAPMDVFAPAFMERLNKHLNG